MPSVKLRQIEFSDLAGWQQAGLGLSLAAFQRSAAEMLDAAMGFQRMPLFGGTLQDWSSVCRIALAGPEPRAFFENHFMPLRVGDAERPEGLFTGYYEPQAAAALVPGYGCDVPIYRKPPDLVSFDDEQASAVGLPYGRLEDGRPQPYLTRKEIECGALNNKGLELAWLNSQADAFFIHVQGQGRLIMPDGAVMRLAFAAKSGRPYTAIGGVLVARGEIPAAENSMQAIRAWMMAHPQQARELMWQNESFVFFRSVEVEDLAIGSVGGQRVNLTPRRSLAIDRHFWMYGTPVWLETSLPPQAGGQMFRELMIAQDTGSAIRGAARGDVYWGWGDEAALIAGHMKGRGAMVALLPNGLARRLLSQAH